MIHHRSTEENEKDEGAQLNQVEEEVDKLIYGLLEEDTCIEKVTEDDNLRYKHNGQWTSPEMI